jgi:hypothetical protein
MAHPEIGWLMSLSLFGQRLGRKQKGSALAASAQSSAFVSALRSLSSVALSSARMLSVYHAFFPTPAKGTSLLCRIGDISTLH